MNTSIREDSKDLSCCLCKFNSDYRRLQASFGKLANTANFLLTGQPSTKFCFAEVQFLIEALELEIKQIGFTLELEPFNSLLYSGCHYHASQIYQCEEETKRGIELPSEIWQ